MNKPTQIEALAFHCDETSFNDYLKELTTRFNFHILSSPNENGIYVESILSKNNIFEMFQRKLLSSNLSYLDYISILNTSIDNMYQFILNRDKKVLFVVTRDIISFNVYAESLQFEQYQLLDQRVIDKLLRNEIQDLSEIEIIVKRDKYEGLFSISLNNLKKEVSLNSSLEPFNKDSISINKYSRNVANYTIEIQSPNVISIQNINGEISIGKALSKSIVKDIMKNE